MNKHKISTILLATMITLNPLSSFATSQPSGGGTVTETPDEDRALSDREILKGSKSLGRYYYGNGTYNNPRNTEYGYNVGGVVTIEITQNEFNQLKKEIDPKGNRSVRLLDDDTVDESKLVSGNQSDTFRRNFNKLQERANNSHLKKGWVDNDTNRQVIRTHKYIDVGLLSNNRYGLRKTVRVDWSLTADEKQEYNKERNKIIEFRNSLSDEEYAQKFTNTQRGQINKIINTDANSITEFEFNAGVFKVAKYRVQREKARMAKLLGNNDNTSENNVCNCK